MTDWATVASLATAGGTLVLAVATFASIRSANRSARIAERAARTAERSLLAGQRPGHRRVITFAVIRAASSEAR